MLTRAKYFFVFLYFFSGTLNGTAQNCTGSVGDPVVNITFGAGSNPGPPLSAATTNYQYVTNACPVNGFYTLLNKGIECNYGWHVLQSDHTGNTNGYFMLVDAAFDPSDFYLDTVKNLCTNTTYEFAAWMLNMKYVTQGTRPNITFRIETVNGQLLQSYNSGDLPVTSSPQWKKYGFYFTTPGNTTAVVLRMTNNAAGGDGNDLALDDITFRPVGPNMETSFSGFTGDTIAICEGDPGSLQLSAVVEMCYPSAEYQWQYSTDNGITWLDIAGATTTSYTVSKSPVVTTLYRLVVAQTGNINSSTCRVLSPVLTVIVKSKSFSTINQSICPRQTYLGYSQSGTYIDTFTAANGCDSIRTLNLFIKPTIFNIISQSICEGQSISGHNVAGTYIDTFVAANGCDSIMTLNLDIKPKSLSTISQTICEGETYLGYTHSGTYNDILIAANGCDSTRTLNLTVKPKSLSVINQSICEGQSYLGYIQSGTYNDTFMAANGCDSIRTLNLQVVNNPDPDLGADRELCEGDTLQLNPGAFDTYTWQDGSTNRYLTVRQQGFYSVIAGNVCGTAGDEINITTRICEIVFPGAFTPNGDGNNDKFKILNGYGLTHYSLIIYDRWGQKVFSATNVSQAWDGRLNGALQNPGTYVWICNYEKSGIIKSMRGTVVLLR